MASHGAPTGKKGKLGKRYAKLVPNRVAALDRARLSASVTIPSLAPAIGVTGDDPLPKLFQGLGAEGLNLLTSKLATGLFPPNTPFFVLSLEEETLLGLEEAVEDGELTLGGGVKKDDVRKVVEEALINTERVVAASIESTRFRVRLNELLRQLIVAGNILLYDPDPAVGKARLFKLDSYVQRRSPEGELVELITYESIAFDGLPDAIKEKLQFDPELLKKVERDRLESVEEVRVPIYNRLLLVSKDKYSFETEVYGLAVDTGGAKTFDAKDNPYLALRWTAISGEDYGRGYVEEFIGDLISLENLSQTLIEGTAALAKLIIMVEPGGVTNIDDITNTQNGAVVHASEADVSVLSAGNKAVDFQAVEVRIGKLEQRIARVFLLTSALRRDAERVTAEEVRLLVRELEEALGGVYPLLTGELQLPLVRLHLTRAAKKNTVAFKGLGDKIEPEIITGLSALGRSLDHLRFRALLAEVQEVSAIFPGIVDYLPDAEIITRLALGNGVERKGLLLSEEEVAEKRAAAAEQEALQAAKLSGAEAAGDTAGARLGETL